MHNDDLIVERLKNPMFVAKFWSRVEGHPTKPKACWPWRGGRHTAQYGMVTLRPNQSVTAQRVAWSYLHGRIADGIFICHSCDTPECCNPLHLFAGTPKDNIRDCINKGRFLGNDNLARGRNGRPSKYRFTEDQIRDIRRRSVGESQRALARVFNVTRDTIKGIASGKTWKYVV